VRSPKAGVSREKLRVLMIRGVSEATHMPVQKPNPEVRTRKLQYCEHIAKRKACPLAREVATLSILTIF